MYMQEIDCIEEKPYKEISNLWSTFNQFWLEY